MCCCKVVGMVIIISCNINVYVKCGFGGMFITELTDLYTASISFIVCVCDAGDKHVLCILLQWCCSDPTSKHASPKYDFLPDAINLLVFRLPVPISHMVLTADRKLYATTKTMKKIQKIIVPEDLASAMVTPTTFSCNKFVNFLELGTF